MKVYFDTVGCRLNQAEIELMAGQFRAAGHEILEKADLADVVVINSCSVTAAAGSDSRQKVRQAHNLGVKKIVLTGCWATLEPTRAANLEGVSQVIDNAQKNNLASLVLGEDQSYDLEPLRRKPLPGARKRTRAFIKAQDGCNNFCTFCVTRIARGAGRSETKEKVLTAVLYAEGGGAREIVLTGVHLGSWGEDLGEGETISDLVRYILQRSCIERVRLSSTEPWNLSEDFWKLWDNPRMCRHLHLPLQSGSASVLRRMARNTNPDAYRRLIDIAREKIPDVAITTDIIVGFPGETDAEFEESLMFVKEIGFSGGHVFRYSAREGTPAAKLANRVHGQIAGMRSRKMRNVLEEGADLYRKKFLGQELNVLWETSKELPSGRWVLSGLSDNYLKINSKSSNDRWSNIDRVRIEKQVGDAMTGAIWSPDL